MTGEETHGGLQLVCFAPKPGRFPERPPLVARAQASPPPPARPRAGGAAELGLAAGGRMRQQLYPDPHGIDTWDQDNYGRVFVHIVNSRLWTQITGEPLPPTPVDVRSYIAAGLPWFDLYDDHLGDIDADPASSRASRASRRRTPTTASSNQQDDSSIDVPNVKHLGAKKVPDGKW